MAKITAVIVNRPTNESYWLLADHNLKLIALMRRVNTLTDSFDRSEGGVAEEKRAGHREVALLLAEALRQASDARRRRLATSTRNEQEKED